MNFVKRNLEEQQRIRLALLENGYDPLPIRDKMCFLEGWGDMTIDRAEVESWGRKRAYSGTAVRVKRGLCSIDIDIDDASVVEEIYDRAEKAFPILREVPIRFGSGAKEMWFCRVEEDFSVLHSATYVRPGEDPDEEGVVGHRVEVFGGGHNRLVGVYGAHTMKKDNSGFAIEYRWLDNEGLLDITLDGLPVLSKHALVRIIEIAGEVLVEKGWVQVRRSRAGEASLEPVYDLTDDMIFNCLDGVARSLDQLAAYAERDRNARCSASWMGDPTLVNRTRCLINVEHDGTPSVLETANFTRHLPVTAKAGRRSLHERVSDLGEKMRALEFDLSETDGAPATFREEVENLLKNWAWCPSRSSRPCVPIYAPEERSMSVSNFRTTQLPNKETYEDRHGKEREGTPAGIWFSHRQRQTVEGYRYLPGMAPGIYEVNGESFINSYRAPNLPDLPSDEASARYEVVWREFMQHLLPIEEEREWFLDWLAHKLQNLRIPGVAVLMVTTSFGVGRGTLNDLLVPVFGRSNVNEVTANLLMGSDSQAQYTDWIAQKTLITVPEVLPEGDDGINLGWKRKRAFERLKELLDPRPREMMIVRKNLPNYSDEVVASFLMATNHINALPLPEGDRRVAVLTNSYTPLLQTGDLFHQVIALKGDAYFSSFLDHWLRDRDVSGFNAQAVPSFTGVSMMQQAGQGEIDLLVDEALDNFPCGWGPQKALVEAVYKVALRNGSDLHEDRRWTNWVSDAIRERWVFMGRHPVGTGTQQDFFLARSTADADLYLRLSPAERGEVASALVGDGKIEPRVKALMKGIREA